MKKSIVFIVMTLVCLTGYGRTPEGNREANEQASLDEQIAGCHTTCRPTDPLYIRLIIEKAELSFNSQTVESEEGMHRWGENPIPRNFHTAVVLWKDLLLWDSISKEEYQSICAGDPIPFLVYDRAWSEPERWGYFSYNSAVMYYGSDCPDDMLALCEAHEQLAKRIYGIASKSYRDAASYYLEALRRNCEAQPSDTKGTKKWMTQAKVLCEDILKNSKLDKESTEYYEWLLNAYQCRLSTEGASKKLQKEIDKSAKGVCALNDTLLMEMFVTVQAECAMLSKDYPYAVQIASNTLSKMQGFKQLPYLVTILHAYVLAEEYEKAESVIAIIYEQIYEVDLRISSDPGSIGYELLNPCDFSMEYAFPYRLALRKQYEDRIAEHYDYRDVR